MSPKPSGGHTSGSCRCDRPADSAVDRENNRIGQAHGVAHAEGIGAALRPALSALADEAGRLWTRVTRLAAGQLTGPIRTTASGGGT